MRSRIDVQLHFDVRSCRAMVSCEGKEYILPDIYPNKDAARVAARKFVWDRLNLSTRDKMSKPSELTVWLR